MKSMVHNQALSLKFKFSLWSLYQLNKTYLKRSVPWLKSRREVDTNLSLDWKAGKVNTKLFLDWKAGKVNTKLFPDWKVGELYTNQFLDWKVGELNTNQFLDWKAGEVNTNLFLDWKAVREVSTNLSCVQFFEAIGHTFIHEAFTLETTLNYAPPRPLWEASLRWK